MESIIEFYQDQPGYCREHGTWNDTECDGCPGCAAQREDDDGS